MAHGLQDIELVQPMRRFALVNGRLITPDEVITGQALIVEDGIIAGIDAVGALDPAIQHINVGGRYLAPGLIDIHTHGALGHTFNEPDAEAFARITDEQLRRGVTGLLATVATAPLADLVQCLAFTRDWVSATRPGAQILGVHLEGPYFNPIQCGAQDPRYLRTPDDGTLDLILPYDDVLRILSYAPELPGALELTRRLVTHGIIAAAGHSDAREAELWAAVDAGLSHVIHVWSGQSSMVREGPWRRPGLLEASLVAEDLTVEMIADNKHLPPTLMKLAYRSVGPDRLCAISDATSGAGLEEGARFRMGSMEYDVHEGVGMLFDRTAFAGSTTLLNQMLPILRDVVGIPLPEVLRMASLAPARVIGYDDRKGSLEAGKDADIAVFDDDFTAWRVMIAGRWAWPSGASQHVAP